MTDNQDFNNLKNTIKKIIDERYDLEEENIKLKLRILELEQKCKKDMEEKGEGE